MFALFYSIALHWTEILPLPMATIPSLLSVVMTAIQPFPSMAIPPTPPSIMNFRDAEAPFNGKASADLILRSADKVNFHVNQLVLALSSPYLEKQLQLVIGRDSLTSGGTATDRPILDLPDDAFIIDFILRCCYSVARPRLEKLEDVRAVLDAARKYDMAVVMRFAEEGLSQFVLGSPLDVLDISIHCGLYSTFNMIFSAAIELPSFFSLEAKELNGMSGAQYHVLVRSHERHANFPEPRCNRPIQDVFDMLMELPLKRAIPRRSPPNPSSEADAPFNHKNADVVLRSSDNIDFHVHKVILSIASPLFKIMLDVSQPGVIEVAEDAQTLDFLLRCIYPVPLPKLKLKVNNIDMFLDAGKKYGIKDAVDAAVDGLFALVLIDAFHAFVLAVRCHVEYICGMATRRLLEIQPTKVLMPKILQYIPATPYRKVLQYHQKCGKAASAVARSRKWFSDYLGVVAQRKLCDCFVPDEQDSGWFAHQEVWDYLKKAEEVLLRSPHSASVLSPSEPFDVSCKKCGRRSYGRELCHALEASVKKATSEKKIAIPKFC